MGRLSGLRYREIVRKLRAFGFLFFRQAAGSHEIWRNETTGVKVTVPRHPKPLPKAPYVRSCATAALTLRHF
jgi:predicted RNA binding protein YcfA (HicA-like mRNA interferase family)